MKKGITFSHLDGSSIRIGIVTARWNSELTYALRDGVRESLEVCNVPSANIVEAVVPGAYELTAGARYLQEQGGVDAIVCLGVLINGESDHYEYVAKGVSHGIATLNALSDVPVIFGVLTCQTEEQAITRSVGEKNHGREWGMSAVEMALLRA